VKNVELKGVKTKNEQFKIFVDSPQFSFTFTYLNQKS